MLRAVTLTVLLCGCGPAAGPKGIAFVRVSELAGACPITFQPSSTNPDFPVDLEFRRTHATSAFRGGSHFPGGNLIVTAWSDPDGKVSRLYVDVGADRGYGATVSPSPSWSQAFGYVEWKDGQRVFAAAHTDGYLTYAQSEVDERGVLKLRPPPGKPPGALFAQVAFDGLDAAGAVACRVLALHADATQPREEPYDPSWFAANPSALIIEGPTPAQPTFADDTAPSTNPVLPDDAAADPGPAAPRLDFGGGTLQDSFAGGNACD